MSVGWCVRTHQEGAAVNGVLPHLGGRRRGRLGDGGDGDVCLEDLSHGAHLAGHHGNHGTAWGTDTNTEEAEPMRRLGSVGGGVNVMRGRSLGEVSTEKEKLYYTLRRRNLGGVMARGGGA